MTKPDLKTMRLSAIRRNLMLIKLSAELGIDDIEQGRELGVIDQDLASIFSDSRHAMELMELVKGGE